MSGNPKLTEGNPKKFFLRWPLKSDFGFSNSIFAACGGAGRQLLGPAN
jgi:hypothetical protein